jgi:hypothetical protein
MQDSKSTEGRGWDHNPDGHGELVGGGPRRMPVSTFFYIQYFFSFFYEQLLWSGDVSLRGRWTKPICKPQLLMEK